MLPENDTSLRPDQPVREPAQDIAGGPDIPDQPQRPLVHPDILVRLGSWLGLVMIGAAVLWVNVLRRDDIWQTLEPSAAWLVLPGLVIGAIFAWLIWTVGSNLSATRQIVALLEQTIDLNAIKFRHVLLFSLLAAFPEELLFRGALQPEVGLIVASVIFGALHGLTWMYFAYATTAGLLLGLLFQVSGTLWLSIGLHFAVDMVMFILLRQRDNHLID